MRRALNIFAALLLAQAAFAQSRVDSIRTRLLDRQDGSVLVAAHRGVWDNAPENSVASIEAAIACGAHIVELDVRKTLAGELILSHYDVMFRPSGACSLEDALLAAKGKIMVNVDKAFGYFDDVVEIAERTGTLDHIIFKSGMPAYKAKRIMGDYAGKVLFMPIIHICSGGALACIEDYVKLLNPPLYEWVFDDDSDPVLTIASARLQGIGKIWVNTMWGWLCGGHDDAFSAKDADAGYGWLLRELDVKVLHTDRTSDVLAYLNR